MKKLFVILAAGIFTFSSCKKDWTCTCKVPDVPFGVTESIKDKKKKEAQSECEAKGGTVNNVTVTCSID